ncbi:MAG: hypothetical protein LBC59_03160 [Chitinispirillales bacterium]|jgi:hypothetical protein|nr:hypothetical protein [Chitinispirillales bacterium]
MHKINYIFAAVFVAAIALGGLNVLNAVDVADKNGISVAETAGADSVRPSVDNNGINTGDKESVNMVRRGRKIQVDGFLLEWRGAAANVWPGSKWLWDAVSTPEGIAGYVSLPAGSVNTGIYTDNNPRIDTVINPIDNAINVNNNDTAGINKLSHPDWVFTLHAVNTGRSLEIKLPGRQSGEFFAYDKGEFDAGGPLTAEWIVPWEFFEDGEDSYDYKLSISAAGTGGGALRPLVLTVEAPEDPRAPSDLLTRLTMIGLIAALTVALVLIRRRKTLNLTF